MLLAHKPTHKKNGEMCWHIAGTLNRIFSNECTIFCAPVPKITYTHTHTERMFVLS